MMTAEQIVSVQKCNVETLFGLTGNGLRRHREARRAEPASRQDRDQRSRRRRPRPRCPSRTRKSCSRCRRACSSRPPRRPPRTAATCTRSPSSTGAEVSQRRRSDRRRSASEVHGARRHRRQERARRHRERRRAREDGRRCREQRVRRRAEGRQASRRSRRSELPGDVADRRARHEPRRRPSAPPERYAETRLARARCKRPASAGLFFLLALCDACVDSTARGTHASCRWRRCRSNLLDPTGDSHVESRTAAPLECARADDDPLVRRDRCAVRRYRHCQRVEQSARCSDCTRRQPLHRRSGSAGRLGPVDRHSRRDVHLYGDRIHHALVQRHADAHPHRAAVDLRRHERRRRRTERHRVQPFGCAGVHHRRRRQSDAALDRSRARRHQSRSAAHAGRLGRPRRLRDRQQPRRRADRQRPMARGRRAPGVIS